MTDAVKSKESRRECLNKKELDFFSWFLVKVQLVLLRHQ